MVIEETKCRICKGELEVVLDLGSIYPSSFLRDDEKVSEDSKAPLVLSQCKECGLVQLKHTLELDSMYRQYWYCSSLNKSMISSLKEIVEEVEVKGYLNNYDLVLDIGCNDGSMLDLYTKNIVKVGFDPALNLTKPNCFFVNDYFSAEKYYEVLHSTNMKAKVITAIACFYDLPDPVSFSKDVSSILDENGVFVIQLTDLLSMMKVGAFDNICFEHLEYYKLSDIKFILGKANLEIIDVSYNDVNGGSLRVTSSHKGTHRPSDKVEKYLLEETTYFGLHEDMFLNLKKLINDTKKKINTILRLANRTNSKILILGASTKGNSLLQLCNISDKNIPFASDVNEEKFGLRTVGSNIKIISENDAFSLAPSYFLVLPWHFKKNLLSKPKIKLYIDNGGKLIFPLPEFLIVSSTGEYSIK